MEYKKADDFVNRAIIHTYIGLSAPADTGLHVMVRPDIGSNRSLKERSTLVWLSSVVFLTIYFALRTSPF